VRPRIIFLPKREDGRSNCADDQCRSSRSSSSWRPTSGVSPERSTSKRLSTALAPTTRQDSALYPFIDQLGRAAGFARDDLPPSKLEKLESLLSRAEPQDEDVAFVADLMSLPGLERHPLPNISPQRRKDRTLEALLRQLDGLAHQRPVPRSERRTFPDLNPRAELSLRFPI
jgi:hypothetical protein